MPARPLKVRKVGTVEVGIERHEGVYAVYRRYHATQGYLSSEEFTDLDEAHHRFETVLRDEEESAQNSAFLDAELFKKARPVMPDVYSTNPAFGRF